MPHPTTHMDIQSIAAVIGIVNILFLAANFVMSLSLKLAISQLREKISEDRRKDEIKMRDYVDYRIRERFGELGHSHGQHGGSS